LLTLALALHAAAVTAEREQAPINMIAVTVADDFETGELNAWESYPYAQDPGFDPRIKCVRKPAHSDSKYSLMRVIEPYDTDFPEDRHRVGLMKRIHLRTTADSRVRMAVFLSADRDPRELRFTICAEDGKRYELVEDTPAANAWIEIDRPACDFTADGHSLPAGAWIEAVAVVATYTLVNPHRSYVINLDDVVISGEAQRRFIAVAPTSTYLEKFDRTILHRHFHPGERIGISVQPQADDCSVKLKSVTATVVDSRGRVRSSDRRLHDDGSHGNETASDGVWSSDNMYTVRKNDPPGVWTVRFLGMGDDGGAVRDEHRFIVPPKRLATADHPRLFFDGRGLDRLRRAEDDGDTARLFEESVAAARRTLYSNALEDIVEGKNINTEHLDGGMYSNSWVDYNRWRNPLYTAKRIVENGAWLYAVTGDEAAGLKAKEAFLRVAAFTGWNHPWFDARRAYTYYPVGYLCQALGIGYDFLYPLFTDNERVIVRRAMLEKGIIPAYRDCAVLDRLPSDVTNHLGVNLAGVIFCAVAMIGEDENNPFMEPYLSGLLAKLDDHIAAAYLPDGSYAESFDHLLMDFDSNCKTFDLLERNLGIDLTTTTNISNAHLYTTYIATGDGIDLPLLGDANDDFRAYGRRLHLWLAHRTGDRLAWQRYLWQTQEGYHSRAVDFFDILWRPSGIDPSPSEELLPSRLFGAKGNAVFRSGWDRPRPDARVPLRPALQPLPLRPGNVLAAVRRRVPDR